MSGSPPLPLPSTTQEGGDHHHRGQPSYGSYPPAGLQHDAYRGASAAAHSQQGAAPLGPPPASRSSYPHEQPERLAYPYPRPDEPTHTSASYPHLASQHHQQQQQQQQHHQQQQRRPSYMSMAGPSSAVQAGPPLPPPPSGVGYPAQAAPHTTDDGQPFTSPKSQRKTKGHVASACVPCKKAHLRCDARRPCSRCQSNGKEDACIDVQHKKRGRPRLRDERDNRYGASSGYSHPQDAAMRRPLSLYSPGAPISGEPLGPRYIERAAPSDASMYAPPPLAVATSSPEPVAYLSPNLEIVRASPTFIDAVGVSAVRGRSLFDIIASSEGPKVQRLQASMQEERGRKDPMYLPPIFGKDHEARVFETLRYDAEELSRIPMDRHEVLVFVAADGQRRPYQVRLGSAKRDSIYFVALSLQIPGGFPYSTPSPHARDMPYNWPSQASSMHSQPPGQQQYGHPQMHGGYEVGQRYGEAPPPVRPGTAGHPPQNMTGLSSGVGAAYSPGIVSGMSAYAASPSRPDYAIGPSSSQIPRSELPPAGRAPPPPPPPPQPQQHYQLPPIRSSPPQGGGSRHDGPPPRRDERSGRVDIGGLIDKPDQPPPSR